MFDFFRMMDIQDMFNLAFPVLCIATVLSGVKVFFGYKIVKLLTEISGKLSKGNDQK